jgi:hypothetical protein
MMMQRPRKLRYRSKSRVKAAGWSVRRRSFFEPPVTGEFLLNPTPGDEPLGRGPDGIPNTRRPQIRRARWLTCNCRLYVPRHD